MAGELYTIVLQDDDYDGKLLRVDRACWEFISWWLFDRLRESKSLSVGVGGRVSVVRFDEWPE